MSTTLFETCAAQVAEGVYNQVIECVSDQLEEKAALQASDLMSWLLVIAGALVFFMQAGFAMLCGGCVRKKNLQNTMLKNLLDACGAAIAFYSVGFAFAFGGQNDRSDLTFVGTANFFSMGEVDQAFWFFEYAFSATSVTIVAGTLAERCQMAAYLWYSLFLTGFVYPVVAHTIWSNNGILSAFAADPLWGIGCIDFAGSGVVHLTGGTTAFIATSILGARKGRFYDKRGNLLANPTPFPGHSMALQLMGTMILWFGCKFLGSSRFILFHFAISLAHVALSLFYSYFQGTVSTRALPCC
jgi:Amt family ammonium transporter